MIVTVQDPRLLAWVQNQIGASFAPGSYTIANVSEDGEVLAVVVYSNWHRTGCEMSISSTHPRWATRGFLRAGFAYPFDQLGLRRVSMLCSERNRRCIVLLHGLGAEHEGTLRRYYSNGSNALVYGLFRDNLPSWILGESNNGQRQCTKRACGA